MTTKQPSQILFIGGGTFTIIGAVAQLFEISSAPYIFAFGTGLIIFFQLLLALYVRNNDDNTRTQRLTRIGLFSSLLLALAVYFMFKGSNSWVVAVLIYALSSFSLSFRGNSEIKK